VAAELLLVSAALRVDARGGIARVVCEQRFVNRAKEPLHVTYSLPLPADSAVAGFSFRVGDKRIVGEIDRTAAARERFEEAVAEGRTAALLEQDRSTLFTQELGNIPPGVEITAEVTLDQRLAWLDEGAWEWRFPTTVMPRYLGEPGRVSDAPKISQDVSDAPLATRLHLSMAIGDRTSEGAAPRSSAHALRTSPRAGGGVDVSFAEEGVRLDRDVVVRWSIAEATVGLSLEAARPAAGSPHGESAYGLLTIVPPRVDTPQATFARDLVVLLDTSGSMGGRPLEQAQRILAAVIESLGEDDTLELIEFSHAPSRWKKEPVRVTASARREALAWLSSRRASGSTEMRDGILEALRVVRPDSQRQVVLVTDGAIGFETEVVQAILEQLPATCRLHTVGVGSAVNRSLTGPAARAGRGVEIVVGLEDDPALGATRLTRRTSAPIVVGLDVGGSAVVSRAPQRAPDLFAGAPVLLGVKMRPEGGDLWVRGLLPDGRRWEQKLVAGPTDFGAGSPSVISLFGREVVEDLELACASGRPQDELRSDIERIGLAFGISTRFTSWVAITEDTAVDPSSPTRRVRMPHELPHGASIDGLGLRGGPTGAFVGSVMQTLVMARPMAAAAAPHSPATRGGILSRVFGAAKARGGFDADPKTRAGGVPTVFEESEGATASRRLRGRILLTKPRELVIEIVIDRDGIDWQPGSRAVVEWGEQPAGPAPAGATIVIERTTRPGPVLIGQTVRLWLRFDFDLPAAKPAIVRLHDGRSLSFEIELDR
jgi:Ca-activated chloride channel family protein